MKLSHSSLGSTNSHRIRLENRRFFVLQQKVRSFRFVGLFFLRQISERNENQIKCVRFGLESAPFSSGKPGDDSQWCLRLYTQGVNEELSEFIGLFLALLQDGSTTNAQAAPSPPRLVTYTCCLIDSRKQKVHVVRCQPDGREFVEGDSWGFPRFLRKQALRTQQRTLLPRDRMTIAVDMCVFGEMTTSDVDSTPVKRSSATQSPDSSPETYHETIRPAVRIKSIAKIVKRGTVKKSGSASTERLGHRSDPQDTPDVSPRIRRAVPSGSGTDSPTEDAKSAPTNVKLTDKPTEVPRVDLKMNKTRSDDDDNPVNKSPNAAPTPSIDFTRSKTIIDRWDQVRSSTSPPTISSTDRFGIPAMVTPIAMRRTAWTSGDSSLDLSDFVLNEKFADVTLLSLDHRRLPAHRLVLASQSPIFARLLDHSTMDMTSNNDAIVPASMSTSSSSPASFAFQRKAKSKTADDNRSYAAARHTLQIHLPADELHEILRYLYSARTDHLRLSADRLIAGADLLNLTRLKEWCEQQLLTTISLTTAPDLLLLAERHAAPLLRTRLLEFVRKNSSQILSSDAWIRLTRTCPVLAAEVLQHLIDHRP